MKKKRNKKAIIITAIVMFIGILLVLAGFFGGWFLGLFYKDLDYKNITPADMGKQIETDIQVYYDNIDVPDKTLQLLGGLNSDDYKFIILDLSNLSEEDKETYYDSIIQHITIKGTLRAVDDEEYQEVIDALFNTDNFNGIDTLISLDGASLIAICAFEFIFENAFAEMYNAQKKLEDVALHDQLTGAFNRSKLNMMCMDDTNELKLRNAGFILLDINEFKKINESFGHDVGDQIIKELFKIIKICTRDGDVCVRMGGEQFLIIVPNQGLARTKEIGERIRTHVANNKDAACEFKISVGTTIYKGGDYHVAINLADKALKFAKENEVDLVVAYEDM